MANNYNEYKKEQERKEAIERARRADDQNDQAAAEAAEEIERKAEQGIESANAETAQRRQEERRREKERERQQKAREEAEEAERLEREAREQAQRATEAARQARAQAQTKTQEAQSARQNADEASEQAQNATSFAENAQEALNNINPENEGYRSSIQAEAQQASTQAQTAQNFANTADSEAKTLEDEAQNAQETADTDAKNALAQQQSALNAAWQSAYTAEKLADIAWQEQEQAQKEANEAAEQLKQAEQEAAAAVAVANNISPENEGYRDYLVGEAQKKAQAVDAAKNKVTLANQHVAEKTSLATQAREKATNALNSANDYQESINAFRQEFNLPDETQIQSDIQTPEQSATQQIDSIESQPQANVQETVGAHADTVAQQPTMTMGTGTMNEDQLAELMNRQQPQAEATNQAASGFNAQPAMTLGSGSMGPEDLDRMLNHMKNRTDGKSDRLETDQLPEGVNPSSQNKPGGIYATEEMFRARHVYTPFLLSERCKNAWSKCTDQFMKAQTLDDMLDGLMWGMLELGPEMLWAYMLHGQDEERKRIKSAQDDMEAWDRQFMFNNGMSPDQLQKNKLDYVYGGPELMQYIQEKDASLYNGLPIDKETKELDINQLSSKQREQLTKHISEFVTDEPHYKNKIENFLHREFGQDELKRDAADLCLHLEHLNDYLIPEDKRDVVTLDKKPENDFGITSSMFYEHLQKNHPQLLGILPKNKDGKIDIQATKDNPVLSGSVKEAFGNYLSTNPAFKNFAETHLLNRSVSQEELNALADRFSGKNSSQGDAIAQELGIGMVKTAAQNSSDQQPVQQESNQTQQQMPDMAPQSQQAPAPQPQQPTSQMTPAMNTPKPNVNINWVAGADKADKGTPEPIQVQPQTGPLKKITPVDTVSMQAAAHQVMGELDGVTFDFSKNAQDRAMLNDYINSNNASTLTMNQARQYGQDQNNRM